jgi:esterase
MAKLFFRKMGDGPELFILHGLHGSSDNWVPVARQLMDKFTVYLPDARNHGQSPHLSTHTYGEMANDLAELMDTEKISMAHIAGHSMGGKVAMAFAAIFPERVNKLMVIDISPRSYPMQKDEPEVKNHQHIMQALLAMDLTKVTSRQQADAMLAKSVNDLVLRQFLLKNLHRQADGSYHWRTNVDVLYKNLFNIVKGFEGQHDFSAFKNPVLFLKGEKSNYITNQNALIIKQLFPQANIETIAGAGHWVHVDQPDMVIEKMRGFF